VFSDNTMEEFATGFVEGGTERIDVKKMGRGGGARRDGTRFPKFGDSFGEVVLHKDVNFSQGVKIDGHTNISVIGPMGDGHFSIFGFNCM
jgi:hypothetical protein